MEKKVDKKLTIKSINPPNKDKQLELIKAITELIQVLYYS